MATPEQAALQHRIKRSITDAQAGISVLDAAAQAELQAMVEEAANKIAEILRRVAGADGSIAAHDLPVVQSQILMATAALRDQQEKSIAQALANSAANGARVIVDLRAAAHAGELAPGSAAALPDAAAAAHDVAQIVANATAEDGLNLSQRIWRNHRALERELGQAIQSAVLQGQSARDATRAAMIRALKVDPELLNQIEMARAGALGDKARAILASPEASAYANASRVFRSEMDRANILAQREGYMNVEGVVGTRFMLSPAHPRYDICDMHASVNLYGLGPGVYPPGKSPLPAHPNTLSYEEPVFAWEVDPAHTTQRDTSIAWLLRRDASQQNAILQSKDKVAALKAGLLQPEEITTPWRLLQQKYQNQLPATE